MVKHYRTEGIVLKRNNFGEADRVVTLFTKDYGKICLVAKGVRRLSSRKKGDLEVFTRTKISVVIGHHLDVIAETESIDSYGSIRNQLKTIAAAYQALELVDRLLPENQEHPDVYYLLVNYLTTLPTVANQDQASANFIYTLLEQLGYWPKDKIRTSSFDINHYAETIMEKQLNSTRSFTPQSLTT